MQKSGVYKLYFPDGYFYIGQSTDISRRIKEHYSSLINNTHFNYRLQDKYNKCNILPAAETLVLCSISELNDTEDKYINLEDPLCLNIKAGGNNNFGINSLTAKYLTTDIEMAFLLLVDNPGIKHKYVADLVGIDISTVHDISAGRNRVFTEMKIKYPDKYALLLKNKAHNTRGKFTTVLKHTDGRVETLITGQYSEFCRNNNIQSSNLSKVINGSRKSTMGWELVETYENI